MNEKDGSFWVHITPTDIKGFNSIAILTGTVIMSWKNRRKESKLWKMKVSMLFLLFFMCNYGL